MGRTRLEVLKYDAASTVDTGIVKAMTKKDF
jgi:hypothetical protein